MTSTLLWLRDTLKPSPVAVELVVEAVELAAEVIELLLESLEPKMKGEVGKDGDTDQNSE